MMKKDDPFEYWLHNVAFGKLEGQKATSHSKEENDKAISRALKKANDKEKVTIK